MSTLISVCLNIFILAARLTAAIPLTTSSPPILSLGTSNVTALNTGNLRCINSPDWATIKFSPNDCYTAIQTFYTTDVVPSGATIFEFLSLGRVPIYPKFARLTPRRYAYRTCTLAIVMLTDLPGKADPSYTPPKTDLSSFVELDAAARTIASRCLSPVLNATDSELGFTNPTGYDIVGEHSGIGVFIWDTESVINRDSPWPQGPLASVQGNLNVGKVGNASNPAVDNS